MTRRGIDALKAGLPFALVAAWAAWAVWGFSWFGLYEINPDEGLNLAKAALVWAGHDLYADIWSDQPPLLTHALALVQQLFPWSVTAARCLVLTSACLLLGALYSLVQRLHGRAAALATLLLLMTAPLFVQLSVSVMVGLPAIALAVLAMDLASRRWGMTGAALAGGVFALSLQTKLFTGLMAPALLLLLWQCRASEGLRRQWGALGAFGVAAAAGLAFVAASAGEAFFDQLLRPHVAQELRQAHDWRLSAEAIWTVLSQQRMLGIAALAGLLWWGWRRPGHGGPVLLWLGVPAVALVGHTPVWFHQVLLLLPPLAWLGGVALAALVTRLWSTGARTGRALAMALPAALAGGAVWLVQALPAPDAGALKVSMGEALRRFAPLGGYVVTDSPMDAFRAGLLVPPSLAVYSHKRVLVGAITPDDVLQALQTWRPPQVAFRRFPVDPQVRRYLVDHYVQTAAWGAAEHHVIRQPDVPVPGPAVLGARWRDLTQGLVATGVQGGYAAAVSADGARRHGEQLSKTLRADAIWMRPPGSTPRVGACLLQMAALTGEAAYLPWAREAARAVVRTQQCVGGWSAEAVPAGACLDTAMPSRQRPTLDEGMTAEAIGFLLDLRARSAADAGWIDASATRALDFLVMTQNAQGAWPYDFLRGKSYSPLATINDDLSTSHLRALLRGYRVYGHERYRQALERGVGFLLRGQSRRGGWAQQYDAQGGAAPGRSFEPAALATIESAYVLHTLIEVDRWRPDPAVRDAIARGAWWLTHTALRPGFWARFHDYRDGRPLYQDRDGRFVARVDLLSLERQRGYRWEGPFPEVAHAIALAEAHLSADPAAFDAARGRLSQVARIAAVAGLAQAEAPLGGNAGLLPLQGEQGLIWAADFVRNCQRAQALWAAGGGAVPPLTLEALLRE